MSRRNDHHDAGGGGRAPIDETDIEQAVGRRRPAASNVLNERYEVGRLIGTGGMATVHVGRDLLLGREVAIKLFRRDVDTGPDLRLQELEARVVATLNHSALTTLLDAGVGAVDGGEPQIYLVMEYVRGPNLRERLRRGRMEVSEACWMGFDLAEGLDYMHQSGFLHRDIKPANVLISDLRSARPVVAKLTDFGIAAPIGQPDLSEYTVGTAAYLSPEQVEGHDARPESDIYSLGIVMLEAMTGTVAFPGTVEESAFARLVRDPPVPAEIPAPIADLLRRMTARRPEQRVDLHTVAIELQQFLVDDLVRRRAAAVPVPAPAPDLPAGSAAGVRIDGSPDEVCSALVRLAALALRVPKAALVLEDRGRTVLKAQHGWDAPVDLRGEPGGGRVAGPDRSWVVRDTAEPGTDVRRAIPLLDGTIRAAAAASLLTHERRVLGTVFVFDEMPRDFERAELGTLEVVAGLIVHELELRDAVRRALLGGS